MSIEGRYLQLINELNEPMSQHSPSLRHVYSRGILSASTDPGKLFVCNGDLRSVSKAPGGRHVYSTGNDTDPQAPAGRHVCSLLR